MKVNFGPLGIALLLAIGGCASTDADSAARYAAIIDRASSAYCSRSIATRSVLRASVNTAVDPYEYHFDCPVDAVELPASSAVDLGKVGGALKLAAAYYCSSPSIQLLVLEAYLLRNPEDGRSFEIYCAGGEV